MGSIFKDIQNIIGSKSKMISSQAFQRGVYIGEVMSPAAYQGYSNLRKERYGIMILPEGMYVGTFPPGHFMTQCIGDFYDLTGQKHTRTFNLNVDVPVKYGDDSDGGYFPPC